MTGPHADDLGRRGTLHRAERTIRYCLACGERECMARTFEPDDKTADREQCWCDRCQHSWWVDGKDPAV